MSADLTILIVLTVLVILIVPIYIFYRSGMTKELKNRNKPRKYYSRKRIKLLVTLLLSINFSAAGVLSILFYSIAMRNTLYPGFAELELIVLFLFFMTWLMISAGSGMYSAAIILERYTLVGLRDEPEFKLLELPTKLMHGPISHLLIFVGGHLSLAFIAFLEILNPNYETILEHYAIYGFIGIVIGAFYSAAQIFNLTWKHQLPMALWISVIYVTLASATSLISIHLPFNFFFLTFCLTYSLGLTGKYIRSRLKHQVYIYS